MALISCPECGKEISDKAVTCPHCGNPINPQVQQTQQEEYLCCPKSGSRELHAEHKGFSGSKALAGVVLTGVSDYLQVPLEVEIRKLLVSNAEISLKPAKLKS